MKLWGGRFTGKLDPAAWALNASIGFDQRLAQQDVRGSIAWAGALEKAGVLTAEERLEICHGLERIEAEFAEETFVFQEGDEDIHTAVERRLGELIGELAGKLHTGRSRNDQVATDFRLWVLEHLPVIQAAIASLQHSLIARAQSDWDVLMPGYTHTQRAQPVMLSHWWLSHFWPLQRDRQRFIEMADRAADLPLGCGALAGAPFSIDREGLAQALGFRRPAPNSLDAVADRDFAAEFLFCAALTGVHLSRLADAVILFSSAEFGFFELSDAFSTGSSLMPQKKNPDMFELARGKSGALLGWLTGMLATLKGLPSAYDKDLQEDKQPVFQAYDTLVGLLPVLAGAVATISPHPERMASAIDAAMLATDLADYLVGKGVPFRQAHSLAGQAVQAAAGLHQPLNSLSLGAFQAIHPAFDEDLYQVFDPAQSIARRNAIGGTAPQSVAVQLQQARLLLDPQGSHTESI
jgi:argininosuccinate lyase